MQLLPGNDVNFENGVGKRLFIILELFILWPRLIDKIRNLGALILAGHRRRLRRG